MLNPIRSIRASKAEYRRLLVRAQSAKTVCGYVYADAGEGESSTDMVFSGHNMICENGTLLAESMPFGSGFAPFTYTEAVDSEILIPLSDFGSPLRSTLTQLYCCREQAPLMAQ